MHGISRKEVTTELSEIKNEVKDLSKRVETLEKQMKNALTIIEGDRE